MNAMKAIRIGAWTLVVVLAFALGAVFYLREAGPGAVLPGTAGATIGGPFSLVDQTGASVTQASLKGHPSAVFFGYTFCPDVCPTTLYEASTWLKELGPEADKLKVYFVTVDPERDDQAQMAAYLQAFDPRIVGLTGTPADVETMLKAYRVFWRKVPRDGEDYLMDHTASIYLLDRNAAFTGVIEYQEAHDSVMAKLKRLIAGA